MQPQPAREPLYILLAEDNPGDALLIREALGMRFPDAKYIVQQDGERMMRWIDLLDSGYAPRPDVILLDLTMPRATGEEVLGRLGQSAACQGVPIVIVTSSDSPRDRAAAARLGANRYFRKPSDYGEFMKLGDLVNGVLAPRESPF
jgi:chemotaxis family two-component system response regulator Rcp1